MHFGIYKTPCKYYSSRQKASCSKRSKVFTFTRRLLWKITSMKPTQFPTTKFSRSSSKVFGRPIAPSSYPSLNLLPWPTPQELRSPLRPSTQYSSSHSKAKVSTTLHSTTIRTPKYQQPKITRVLVGTDTTATKSLPKHISITHIYQHFSYIEISAGDKDPVQTPPNLEV